MKENERQLSCGSIEVRELSEAALIKFSLCQLIDDDKWMYVVDPSCEHKYGFGIVAQEEDLPKIDKLLRTLDYFNILYTTDFDLPTT